jgi:hypothetical protein
LLPAAEEVLDRGVREEVIERGSITAGGRGLESLGRDVDGHLEAFLEVLHDEVAGVHEVVAKARDVAVEDDEDERVDWAGGVFVKGCLGREVN